MYTQIYLDTSVVPVSLTSVRVNALRFRGRRNGVSLLDIDIENEFDIGGVSLESNLK